jgi:cytochrome c oxidase subunit 4
LWVIRRQRESLKRQILTFVANFEGVIPPFEGGPGGMLKIKGKHLKTNGAQNMPHHDSSQEQRVINYGTYILIWFALIVLTGLTVAVSGTNLGGFSVWTAILIAAVKTTLVLFVFMHLKYERPLFRWMILVALVAITIFIVLTFFDVSYR